MSWKGQVHSLEELDALSGSVGCARVLSLEVPGVPSGSGICAPWKCWVGAGTQCSLGKCRQGWCVFEVLVDLEVAGAPWWKL